MSTRRIIRLGRLAAGLVLAAFLCAPVHAESAEQPDQPSEKTWTEIKDNIFNGVTLEDGTGILSLETPLRAEDAAIVPVSVKVTLPEGDDRTVKRFTLVIDENPAPLAGIFEIGPSSGVTAISTRVRVNSYTYVHAAAELSDGKTYVVKNYVKASGGCSAPASKDADEVAANTGALKFKQFSASDGAPDKTREAQIMIRHPNYSGMQMDQVTRYYIPANFVEELKVWQGDSLVFTMNGAISISEDPNIRFTYMPNGADHFRAEARDTKGRMFKAEWPVESGAM
jgi:sulfur-oxidizing protein SoxY